MDKQQENAIRSYSDDELIFSLESRRFQDRNLLFIVCDELLMRNIKITHLSIRFETLVRSLSKSLLLYIERYDYAYCKASVHVAISELQKRGKEVSQWFTMKGEVQTGPYTRLDIENRIQNGEISQSDLIWKEGMSNWKTLAELNYLSKDLFFEQEVEAERQGAYQAKPKTKIKSKSSSTPLVLGVLELLTFPFWLILLFIVPFSSFSSFTGLSLPVTMVVFSLIACVPLGLGLINKRPWAWHVKMVSGVLIVMWFVSKVLMDDSSSLWLMFALYEIIILTFAFTAKESFKINQYGSPNPNRE